MVILVIAWLAVGILFFGLPSFYFLYMRRKSNMYWNLQFDTTYLPSIAILVPVHNEQNLIRLKMENLSKVEYPSDKLDIIIANDCSTDNTANEVNQYIATQSGKKIKLFNSNPHLGKTSCLNNTLKDVQTDIVIISDVDCFWPNDILTTALPYLSDPTVGAITARELLLNPDDSWITLGEQFYDSNIQSIRIGESKIHSTIFFQGGFAAYKRSVIDEFNHATDDSGTALDVVQKKLRTLLIPEIGFFTVSPITWKNKIQIKLRRAGHLQHLWARCFNLLVRGKLLMPKRIAIPEIFLHIFNPVLLVILLVLSVAITVVYPVLALVIISIVCAALLVKRLRIMIFELAQTNLILFLALTSFVTKRNFKIWKPLEQSRFAINANMLKKKNLI
ncbi:MAG: glycosyltransferase [Crenarchaeota archaeon]|nr:glycosyltransferase [Thermoproteota archaeon]